MKRLLSLVLALGLSVSLALPACALEVEDAKELLKTYYIDPLPEQFDEMDDLDEILAAINDPYTSYLSAEEYTQLQTSINGQTVVGIGASLELIFDNGYRVLSVLPDSPALEAGLEAGDVILAVDGRTLTAADDVTSYIRGQEDTPVTLTIRKNNTTHIYDLTLTRKSVHVPIVTYEMVEDALVIQCDSFGDSTASGFRDALTEFEEKASVCIVDLRSNPGGTSTAAAGSAGMFLGGNMMSYFRDAAGKYNYVYTLPNCPDLSDKPVIVLTSDYSASGSELFAAAIRDHKAGISVGQRTFGKGVAQYVFDKKTNPDLFDGDCLKITVYRFFSPDGATNDTVGVIPTLAISDEYAAAASLLLSAAKPEMSKDHLKLELGGYSFYVDLTKALQEENQAAFVELLEALPSSTTLYQGIVGAWTKVTPEKLASSLGLPFTARTFADLSDSPYAEEINTLASLQLLSGFGDGTFQPHTQITRGQFCAMISAALNLSPAPGLAEQRFCDMTDNLWMAGAVGAMADRGFIRGFEDGSFRPDAAITYQEVVTILNHVAAWATMNGYDYNKMPLAGQAVTTYGHYAPWAQLSARNLDLFGALLSDADPVHAVTREEAAASLCRLMEGCGLLWR